LVRRGSKDGAFAAMRGTEGLGAVFGIVLVAAAVFSLGAVLDNLSLDAIFGILTVCALLLITVPLMTWMARKEGDRRMAKVLLWALLAKFVGTAIRYFVITVVYGDNGDAGNYSGAGTELARMYLKGQFTLHPPSLVGRGVETERIGVVVGILFVFTGSSRYAASFIFGWFCFLGQLLMWRAMHRAVPEADHRRYALLVLFMPSMLFWPSSIGKEALMVCFVGVACYGAAQILGEKVSAVGVLIFIAGAGGLFFIRPHMALIAIVSLVLASLVSSLAGFDREKASKAFFVRMAAIVLLLFAASLATTQLSKVLGNGNEGEAGITSALERTKGQTSTGGSEFKPPAVSTPADLPAAIVTVLFRPFPWEAKNLNGLIAASEGTLLAVLMITGRRRLLNWARYCLKRPYLVYTATYAIVFIVAFSYIGNFGILARQRTQMLPLAFTLLGMPIAVRKKPPIFGLFTSDRGDRPKRPSGKHAPTVVDDALDDPAPAPEELVAPRGATT